MPNIKIIQGDFEKELELLLAPSTSGEHPFTYSSPFLKPENEGESDSVFRLF